MLVYFQSPFIFFSMKTISFVWKIAHSTPKYNRVRYPVICILFLIDVKGMVINEMVSILLCLKQLSFHRVTLSPPINSIQELILTTKCIHIWYCYWDYWMTGDSSSPDWMSGALPCRSSTTGWPLASHLTSLSSDFSTCFLSGLLALTHNGIDICQCC